MRLERDVSYRPFALEGREISIWLDAAQLFVCHRKRLAVAETTGRLILVLDKTAVADGLMPSSPRRESIPPEAMSAGTNNMLPHLLMEPERDCGGRPQNNCGSIITTR